jgi:hypothetical protein
VQIKIQKQKCKNPKKTFLFLFYAGARKRKIEMVGRLEVSYRLTAIQVR